MDYRILNVNNRRLKDPHVVILGAGASIAACKIDKNGRELPVLRNMHKILDLEGYLEGIDFIADRKGYHHFFQLGLAVVTGVSKKYHSWKPSEIGISSWQCWRWFML